MSIDFALVSVEEGGDLHRTVDSKWTLNVNNKSARFLLAWLRLNVTPTGIVDPDEIIEKAYIDLLLETYILPYDRHVKALLDLATVAKRRGLKVGWS